MKTHLQKTASALLALVLITPMTLAPQKTMAESATIEARGVFARFDLSHCERRPEHNLCRKVYGALEEAEETQTIVSINFWGVDYIAYPDGSLEIIY